MKETFDKILSYTDYLNTRNIGLNFTININGLKNKLYEDQDFHKEHISRLISRIKRKENYELSQKQTLLYYLSGIEVEWGRPGQNAGEVVLHGGFAFNGLTDVLTMPTDFWAHSVNKFRKNLSTEELAFFNKLSWFESPTPHASAVYTPMYGCLELLENKFPEKLFFYDSATVYELDMTIEAYISNLLDSVALYCWQYFYINPEEIIKKNKGVKGASWYMTMEINFPEENDRLQNIIRYMEYCMEYLPGSFPGMDFSFHQNSLEKLKLKL